MIIKKMVLSVFVVVVLLLSSCSTTEQVEKIEVVDMVGDTVEVPLNPSNVAVIARAAGDMMIGFGLGDKVDGMYYSILDNPWVQTLYPESENYHSYDYNESAELFLSRGVDLVLAPEQYIAEGLRESGVNAITVSLYGSPDYGEYLYYLADLISQIWPESNNKVTQWSEELTLALTEVKVVIDKENIPKRTVYYVRGDKNKGIGYTDTGYSLLETIYNDYLNMTYLGREFESNKPSAEEIISLNPDVIVFGGIYQNLHVEQVVSEEPYVYLDAVSDDQLITVPVGFVMWEQNSIMLPLFVYDQANKLYPDLFEYDIAKMTLEKYRDYFEVTLTDFQIEQMLSGMGPDGNRIYE